MSGMMSMMAGNVRTSIAGDTNLAYNNANVVYWFRNIPSPGSGITVNLNNAGTITSADGTYAGGPTRWYTGTPTGSNFEVRVTWTSSGGPGSSTVLIGPSGSQTAITLLSTSAWYNLGSNILMTVEQFSGSVEDIVRLTVVIRQVAVTTNSTTKAFDFNWFF
jgi:hypothetical protein